MPALTRGWSAEGHKIVAHIAANFLNFKGRHFVAEHLGGKPEIDHLAKCMQAVSTFADTVEWSKSLHFAYTSDKDSPSFNMETDCPDRRCIVTGIGNFTARATRLELHKDDRTEAIKFLIHLVADIHNPLHVGFENDAGGNSITLASPPLDEEGTRQIEYGVFDDDAESYEPWKLTAALLDEIPRTRAKRAHLSLDLRPEDFETEQAGVDVAARMATETSKSYTVKYAYQRRDNDWIQRGDGLDSDYMRDRSSIAMELLKKAGVRLAAILNSLACVYYRRKAEKATKQIASSSIPSSQRRIDGSMYFEFDFDADDLIEDSDEVDLDGSEGVSDDWLDGILPNAGGGSLSGSRRVGSKRNKPKRKQSSKGNNKAHASKTQIVDEEEEAEEEEIFEGVNLKQVILVERKGLYVIVDRRFKGIKRLPAQVIIYSVRFNGNPDCDALLLYLDAELVKFTKPSDSLIARILAKIRKTDLQPGFAPPPLQEIMDCNWAPMNLRRSMQPQYYKPPIASMIQPLLHTQKVCSYKSGQTLMFILADTIKSPDPIIRTSFYRMENPAEDVPLTNVLIEEKLYSGKSLESWLGRLRMDKFLSAEMLRHRPSLLEELEDFDTLAFGIDPNRSLKLKQIKWFTEMETGHTSFTRFHWSIEPMVVTEEPQLEGVTDGEEPFAGTGDTAFKQEVLVTPNVDSSLEHSALYSGVGVGIVILIALLLSLNY